MGAEEDAGSGPRARLDRIPDPAHCKQRSRKRAISRFVERIDFPTDGDSERPSQSGGPLFQPGEPEEAHILVPLVGEASDMHGGLRSC
jgi:hypothetical protein